MTLQDIKKVYDRRVVIKDKFFAANPERKKAYDLCKKSYSDNKQQTVYIPDDLRDELREVYLDRIGKDNIQEAQTYDVNLVSVNGLGEIVDLNFPTGFVKSFSISLGVDFAAYFICGVLSFIFGGIINIILLLCAWAIPICFTIMAYSDAKHETDPFIESPVKTENEISRVSKVKYAPILAFLIFLAANIVSWYVLFSEVMYY